MTHEFNRARDFVHIGERWSTIQDLRITTCEPSYEAAVETLLVWPVALNRLILEMPIANMNDLPALFGR